MGLRVVVSLKTFVLRSPKGRRLRPGGAGLSRRRTDVGAAASAPVPTRLTAIANRRRGKSARAPPAHVPREAAYPTLGESESFRPVPGSYTHSMAQAPVLPRGFELPLEPRLPRIGSVD